MDGQVTKFLILLLVIIDDFIQADPKIDLNNDPRQYNDVLNKMMLQKIQRHDRNSRKQGDEDAPPSFFVNDEEDTKAEKPNEDPNTRSLEQAEETVLEQEQLKHVAPLSSTGSDDKKFKNNKTRSLKIGDVFTPEEFLEVSRRLFKKVKKPGKGIVTSAKNEYELADKLFERYFLTLVGERIVEIRDVDIEGLDALQALSLDGDVVRTMISRSDSDSFTEAPEPKFFGFRTNPGIPLYGSRRDDYPRKCHYKVLRKWIKEKPSSENINKTSVRRTAEKLKKTLGKNRKIVINPSRREQVKNINYKLHDRKRNKLARLTNQKRLHRAAKQKIKHDSNFKHEADNGVICRWKYQCAEEFKPKTCRLHPYCSNQPEYKKAFIDDEEPDENIRRVREAVGISVLDEKVEKIIEAHVVLIVGVQTHVHKKIQALMEYFNKLVKDNFSSFYYTTPMSPQHSPGHQHLKLNAKQEEPPKPDLSMNAKQEDPPNPNLTMDSDDQEARRILGLIPYKKRVKQRPSNKS